MADESKDFTPYTTEQKKEFAKQFTQKEIQSYHKGRRNAYSHMANIGKRESFFIQNNLNGDTAPPPPAPPPARPYNRPPAAAPQPAPKPAPQGQQQMNLPPATAKKGK